jgi:hypothetical protein
MGGDARFYVDMVRFYRGEATEKPQAAPFNRRVLAPLAASIIPSKPMTALNIVNVWFLGLGLVFVYCSMRSLGANEEVAWTGSAVFVVSFPCFYYGAIGYVDPVLIGFLSLFVLGLSRRSNWLMIVSLLLGTLAKESMLLAVPAFVMSHLMRRETGWATRFWWSLAGVAAAVVPYVALKSLVAYEWNMAMEASLQTVLANLARPRSWLSFGLSFGLPGAVCSYLAMSASRRRRLLAHPAGVPLIIGGGGGLVLAIYAIIVAYADGRSIWTIYPFCLAMIGIMLANSHTSEQAG